MSDLSQLPPNVQERIARLQQLQNTMQQLLAQKQRLEAEKTETERAITALNETPEGAKVYKSVGAVLVEKDKVAVVKERTDRKDYLEMREKVLVKQEEKTKEKLTGLQETLQKELGLRQQGSVFLNIIPRPDCFCSAALRWASSDPLSGEASTPNLNN